MKKLVDMKVDQKMVAFAIFLAGALTEADAPAYAQANGCASFEWSLAIEMEWFAASDLHSHYESGANLQAFPHSGFALSLLPVGDVTFVVAPEKPVSSGWGGILRLPPPVMPGVYQITLSDEAWIDVVQEGSRLRSQAHTGRKDCADVRKSVRFDFGSAPVMLQFSSETSKMLKIAIRKIDEK